MVVHTKSESSVRKYTSKQTNVEKEWENLQNILKSAIHESLGKNKVGNMKIFKNMG
jgi:hypothetical protein